MTDNIILSGKTVTRQLTQYYVPLNILLCAQWKTIKRTETGVTVKKLTRYRSQKILSFKSNKKTQN